MHPDFFSLLSRIWSSPNFFSSTTAVAPAPLLLVGRMLTLGLRKQDGPSRRSFISHPSHQPFTHQPSLAHPLVHCSPVSQEVAVPLRRKNRALNMFSRITFLPLFQFLPSNDTVFCLLFFFGWGALPCLTSRTKA